MRRFKPHWGALVALAISGQALATPSTFVDHAAFMGALPGPASILDFDGVSPGTAIPDGGSLGGIAFHYDFGGIEMLVGDTLATTSSPNSLGTEDGDLFLDGDDFAMSLGPVSALGLFFITADVMFDDDIVLSGGGGAVGLDASAVQDTLSDGASVYFLGIVNESEPFTAAAVSTIGGGFFLYNIDDITTSRSDGAVPEPNASGLVAVACLLAFWRTRRERGKH